MKLQSLIFLAYLSIVDQQVFKAYHAFDLPMASQADMDLVRSHPINILAIEVVLL